ncbi:hypothetical protein GW17_00030091 [Ensete ventricosum]|nr:hypothetical protein GW17_00030091 [Ensete ventricosum]
MIALSLLRDGRPMITVYAEGSSTTMKETIRVLVLGSSLKVIGRVTTPEGAVASWVNPVKVEVMGVRSLLVLDLVLQVVALLGVMIEVAVEATVASAVAFLGLNPHWVGGFEESFLPDLEEDLSLDKVEWSVGELGNDLLYSFRPLPWELGWWALRGFNPRSLLVFPLLCHQGLGGDILVGPLQHFRHSRWVSLHKRPKEAGRSDPDHVSG